MVDLGKIHALLASVAGFTEGPWRIAYTAGQGGIDSSKVYTDAIGEHPFCIGDVNHYRYVPADQKLFAAAPDLHRELMEAVGEIERLRAHNARMVYRLAAIADACAYADETGDRGSIWEAVSNVVAVGSGKSLRHVEEVLRRLAAGEVDDG